MNTSIQLSRHEFNYIAKGLPYAPEDRVITDYRISGMPEGQEARIANFGNLVNDGYHDAVWKILRVTIGQGGSEWIGSFKSADEAQTALEAQLESELKQATR